MTIASVIANREAEGRGGKQSTVIANREAEGRGGKQSMDRHGASRLAMRVDRFGGFAPSR
jgi:hypothetical protein